MIVFFKNIKLIIVYLIEKIDMSFLICVNSYLYIYNL